MPSHTLQGMVMTVTIHAALENYMDVIANYCRTGIGV